MCVCNSQLIMGISRNIIIKVDLDRQSPPDEIEVSKIAGDMIEKLYLDPTGNHLIVVMASGDSFYLNKMSRKPRLISKLKGHKITAVAWNNLHTTDTSTGRILVGTSKGLLFEVELIFADDGKIFTTNFENFNKQIYDFTRDKHRPITGILFDKYPNRNNSKANNYFLIVVVQGRLYQFVGSLTIQSESSMFGSLFADVPERFQDIPCSLNCSQVTCYSTGQNKPPTRFAWLTDSDVLYGRINISPKSPSEDVIIENKLISIFDGKDNDKKPVGMVLTAFHCLVLFPDRLKVFCLLDDNLVESDAYDSKFGHFSGLICDPIKKVIWAYTSKAVYKYNAVEETRDIWRMHLNNKEFGYAKQFCPNIEKYHEEILNLEADHLFSIGRYEECALLYAKSRKSFAEITLNLSKLDNKEPLKQFLKAKYNDLGSEDKLQATPIMAWLVEIWMYEIGQLRSRDEKKFKDSQDEFRRFVKSPKARECIIDNHRLVYNLMLSHGNIEDLVFVATLIHDHDKVISHHIQQENYIEAINVLSEQGTPDLIYKYLPQLMRKKPKEMVDLLIKRVESLDPIKISRLLVRCEEGRPASIMSETVRYLEFCSKNFIIKDKLFHNHLISLYVKLKLKDQLMVYLDQQGEESICYDTVYALRLCAEQDLHEACIQIYTAMQLYNEAVEQALKTDLSLALDTASKPYEDDDLRRKLWLKITRHMIRQEGDVVKAMDFVKNCDLVSIQDLLPYFPDFTTIEHFKDAICLSLKKYNDKIEEFKRDMAQSNEAVCEIKEQIDQYRNGFVKVDKQKCTSCDLPLTMKPFYIFPPCRHCFHMDCLTEEVLTLASKEKRKYIRDLKDKVSSSSSQSGNKTRYKKELDEAIASECVHCGDLMIESIDKPFISENEFDQVLQSWL